MKNLICGSTLQAIYICDGLAKMWPELLGHGLTSFCRAKRLERISSQEGCFSLRQGVDFTVPRQLARRRHVRTDTLTGLQAIWQGALVSASKPGFCTRCRCALSLEHVLWQCPFIAEAFHDDMQEVRKRVSVAFPLATRTGAFCKQCGTLCLPRTVLVYVQREFSPLGGPFKGRVWFLLRMGLQGRVAVTPGSACHAGPLVPTLWALQAPGVWAV